ncbi:assimilatory sulfite reductase (NADPH) [Malassezia psittaci]|uniref:assimilatory sulfite reductase (NADPH) n=1 Tax=Malassezia psittaci TaxID=1821823 RepID=A0AAF0FAU0_9BASI|nr:assimilatory sulfite reductase (NADPH) [Malassezia psittaci]
MTSSRSSALQSTALFAGGALAGAGLYSLARSLASSKQVAENVSKPDAHSRQAVSFGLTPSGTKEEGPKEQELVPELPFSPLNESVTSSDDSHDLYDECGVMGIPYEARSRLPPVEEIATHMNLEETRPMITPDIVGDAKFDEPVLIDTLTAIEWMAYAQSSVIFSYESAASGGFGAYCEAKERAASQTQSSSRTGAKVYPMQARAGAGNAIAGFLAGEGTALVPAKAQRPAVTVLTNAQGFFAMGPALASIREEDRQGLVVHVSSASQSTSEELLVTNDYAATLSTAGFLGDVGFEVILSSTKNDAIECTQYAYSRQSTRPLIHIFDGAYIGTEVGRTLVPSQEKSARKDIAPFAYTGPSSPDTVLLLPNGSQALAARALLISLPGDLRGKIAVVSARRLSPWSASELAEVLPKSVSLVRVVEEAYSSTGGALYSKLLEASLCGELNASIQFQSIVLKPGEGLSAEEWHQLLKAATSTSPISLQEIKAQHQSTQLNDLLSLSSAQLVTFVGSDKGVTAASAQTLAKWLFDGNAKLDVRLSTRYDNYHAAGAVRADLVFSDRTSDIPMPVLTRAGASHILVISDPAAILKGYAALDSVRENGVVLLNAAKWTTDDVHETLYAIDKNLLAERKVSVYVIDAMSVAGKLLGDASEVVGKGKRGDLDSPTARDLAPSIVCAAVVNAVNASRKSGTNLRLPQYAPVEAHADKALASAAETHTMPVETQEFATASDDNEKHAQERISHLAYNSFTPNADEQQESGQAAVRASWAFAAWQLLFREAYALDEQALRPNLAEKTYNVSVSVNRRLTPMEYDRNLFHMELDTRGTGLKYEVGEALGVYGLNDDEEVSRFIKWSGYNPEEIVSAPSATQPGEFESRTVFQVLQQNLDIFGKPPKSFFEALGKVVASKDEERWLRFISSAEGASTFKKVSEDETVTYVDVLHMFPTARVSVAWLMENVELIKPRHYSIASAQVVVGDSVHLLIVTVDWQTPRGSMRYGQCTRYLSRLTPGSRVTVSIKPSVMKLPPLETQPIIMAGLGTGAAPFRAFLQARAYQRAQGKEVGPMYYYFGSRHQSAEYLYGEELEAYLSDGLLTHLGLAFSRDQTKKVYIQHKIKEDGRQLTAFLAPELDRDSDQTEQIAAELDGEGRKGIFTLCGPVWPVPDIQEALVGAFIERGWTKEQAEKHIEDLKDEERYVLEVY